MKDRVQCVTCKAHWDRSRSAMCGVCHDLEYVPVQPTRGDIDALLLAASTPKQVSYLLAVRTEIDRQAMPLEEPRH